MEIMDIIKEAFIFPSQNLEKLAIYIVLMFIIGILSIGCVFTGMFAVMDSSIYFILTAILAIVAIVIAFLISGYQISIIKSGIEFEEEAPEFDWLNDIITGIKVFVVSIVYFIIPTIVVSIVALLTNVPGQFIEIGKHAAVNPANATAVASGSAPIATISDAAAASFLTSITITAVIAFVLFIIFAFLHTMGESRLANTGNLAEAINVVEAFKDITRIGAGKVISVIVLVVIIVAVINAVLGYLYGQIPQLSILSIIVTPYMAFFTQRATGLLYSDIA